jgi:hypothetical protein
MARMIRTGLPTTSKATTRKAALVVLEHEPFRSAHGLPRISGRRRRGEALECVGGVGGARADVQDDLVRGIEAERGEQAAVVRKLRD